MGNSEYIYLLIAILAWTYVRVLTADGMIFSRIDKWFDGKWIYRIIGCEYCLAGQLALWYFLYNRFYSYDLIEHILMIGVTIFLVRVINNFMK